MGVLPHRWGRQFGDFEVLGEGPASRRANFNAITAGLGQQLCVPPNLAGWKGGRTWMNPATMIERENFARYILFPKEIPAPKRKPMDFVPDIIGDRAYQQMNEMAKRNDFISPPEQTMEDSGFNRREYNDESYNIFRGVYNGGIKTVKVIKFETPVPAKVDRRQANSAFTSIASASLAVSRGSNFDGGSLPAQRS